MCHLCRSVNVLKMGAIFKQKIKIEHREELENGLLFELKSSFISDHTESLWKKHVGNFLDDIVFDELNVENLIKKTKSIFVLEGNNNLSKKLKDFIEKNKIPENSANEFKQYAYFFELFLDTIIYSTFDLGGNRDLSKLKKYIEKKLNKSELDGSFDDEWIEEFDHTVNHNYNKIKEAIYYDGNFLCTSDFIKYEGDVIEEFELPDYDFIDNRIEFNTYFLIAIEYLSEYIREDDNNNQMMSLAVNYIQSQEVNITTLKQVKEIKKIELESKDKNEIFLSPKYLSNELKKSVKGQDHIVDVLSLTSYHQLMRKKGYIKNRNKIIEFIVGDTGTGKTFLIRQLAKLLDLPYCIIPVTSVTSEGWDGSSISKILSDMYYQNDDGKYGLVFFDEVDKISNQTGDKQQNSINMRLQNELLTVVEGQKYENGVDTSEMMFVFGGSFDDFVNKEEKSIGFHALNKKNTLHNQNLIKRDFLKFGIKKELLGRIQSFLILNPLNRDILKEILPAKDGFLEYYEEFFKGHNINIVWDDSFLEHILDVYYEDDGSDFGARYLNDVIYKILNKFMIEIAIKEKKDKAVDMIITKDMF